MRNVYEILVWKSRHRKEDNIKVDLKKQSVRLWYVWLRMGSNGVLFWVRN